MSSQFHNLLDVQHGTGRMLRQDSYGSSQSSGQESYGSGRESNSQSSQSEGSSRQTPSEYSLPTPDDDRPDIDQFYFGMDADMPAFAINNTRIKRLSDDSNASHQSLSLIRPEMLASLTSQYDYKLNRYSSVTGVSDMQQFEEDSEEDESEGGEEFDVDFDDDDMYSPIEIARPVSVVMIQQKPAVVSISSPRSPTFPPSDHESSSSRPSLESRGSAPHSRSSSMDKALPSIPRESGDLSEEEEEEEDRLPTMAQSHVAQQMVTTAPAAIPPRRASSRMNNLKKLIRTTSSQLLDIKEESTHPAPKLDRRDSTASSVYSRATAVPRNLDFGAFIISPPPSRNVSNPSVVIPTRSTSRRHSKDLTTSPTAPQVTPRNPRRNIGQRPTPIHADVTQETWV